MSYACAVLEMILAEEVGQHCSAEQVQEDIHLGLGHASLNIGFLSCT